MHQREGRVWCVLGQQRQHGVGQPAQPLIEAIGGLGAAQQELGGEAGVQVRKAPPVVGARALKALLGARGGNGGRGVGQQRAGFCVGQGGEEGVDRAGATARRQPAEQAALRASGERRQGGLRLRVIADQGGEAQCLATHAP